MRISFAKDIEQIRYAIRDLVPIAKEVEAKGKDVIYLNIGDPLKYDFKTPDHIIDALYQASLENHNYYAESQGILELREAIARHEKRVNNVSIEPEHIVVTQGVSEGIIFTCRILLEMGDNILVPSPTYPLYTNVPLTFHSTSLEYKLEEDNNWEPDLEDIRRLINNKTRFIVIINPNNPTGAVFNEKSIREIINIAGEHGIPIVSDEIYNQIIYGSERIRSPASLSNDVPVIVLNGFSKAYLMTGWRVGYMYIHDPSGENIDKFIELTNKMARMRLSANILAQYGALAALNGPQDHIKEINRKFEIRSMIMYRELTQIQGIDVNQPKGGFYIFPRIDKKIFDGDDRKFVLELLRNEGVFVVNGDGFGRYGIQHFRAVTLPPEDILRDAMERISRFIRKIIR
jgi:tyrosine/nicotianamine family aminotransferase